MSDLVHVGSHADILASGRSIGPGERVSEKELHEDDQHLLDEGVLVAEDSFDMDAPNNLEHVKAAAKAAEEAAQAEKTGPIRRVTRSAGEQTGSEGEVNSDANA